MNGIALSVSRGIARVTGAALGPVPDRRDPHRLQRHLAALPLRELPHRHELYGPGSPSATTSPSS